MFNTKIAVSLILLVGLVFVVGVYHFNQKEETPIASRNYKAEVLLQVSPNMESRMSTEKDIDTKLNLITPDGRVYRLFESRDMATYGKTFVVEIE